MRASGDLERRVALGKGLLLLGVCLDKTVQLLTNLSLSRPACSSVHALCRLEAGVDLFKTHSEGETSGQARRETS